MTAEPASEQPASENGKYRFLIEESDVGKRLDAFLTAQFPDASRVRIKRGITDGLVQVDGKPRKPSYKLRPDESIEYELPPPLADGPQAEPIPLDLIYEDDVLAVVNKPAGMIVHPAKGHWAGTMASALVHHFENLSQYGGASRPGIVHRLDRDTSGAIVVAKNDTVHAHLADQFKARTVKKEYLAIVSGCPNHDRDLIDHPIGDHKSQREKKALRSDHSSSREAQTFYEVEERFKAMTLVRAFPRTGRTHQIRLHLAHIHCQVLCDKLYGGRSRLTAGELRTWSRVKSAASEFADDVVLLDRQALHAHRLSFEHPTTGEPMSFTAPLPDDMKNLLSILQQIPTSS